MMHREKIAGAFYGLAIGDALGAPTEFMKLKQIRRVYGQSGNRKMPMPALFTDDTQMTLAVARALGSAEDLHPHELAWRLRTEFVRWARRDEPRAPGITCLQAVRKLHKRFRWQDATVAHSKGCGANMRVAPTAFLADQRTALGASQLQAAMTHGHPTALAATEMTALAIRWAAGADRIQELPGRMLSHIQERIETGNGYDSMWLGKLNERRWPAEGFTPHTRLGWFETRDWLERAIRCASKPGTPKDACLVVGDGWTAETALSSALYFVLKYWHDPALVVSEASRTSGDSDSIASIAGAIIGAFYGEEGWPKHWRQVIERKRDIETAIDITYALS
jgi:ADP-ribosylglycohydrolase